MLKKLFVVLACAAGAAMTPVFAADHATLPEGSRLVFGALNGSTLTNATVMLPDGSSLSGLSIQGVDLKGASVTPEGLATGGEVQSGRVVAIDKDSARGVGSAELVGTTFAVGGATVSVLAVVGTIVTVAIVREGIRTTTTHGS